MDIDALKAFVTVAECGSFSLAAQQLHLTQPAVSKRISSLETRLNHPLFDRLGREVTLTEAGEALMPRARAILHDIAETERSIKELSGEIVGSLRVATSHHIGLHHLPPILREFASSHREVNLQFEFLDSEQAHEKVLRGDVDFAVVTLAPELEPPLQGEVIWLDELVFVAAVGHPLTRHKNLSLEQLSQEAAILPDLNTFTGRLVQQAFADRGLKLNLNMATNYLETIKMMVTVGLGWSVLPRSMLDENIEDLEIKNIQLVRALGVVKHQKRTMGKAANAFYELLRAKQHINDFDSHTAAN